MYLKQEKFDTSQQSYSIDEVIASLNACSDWPPTSSKDCSFLSTSTTTSDLQLADPSLTILLFPPSPVR